jgi:hypothetical protein
MNIVSDDQNVFEEKRRSAFVTGRKPQTFLNTRYNERIHNVIRVYYYFSKRLIFRVSILASFRDFYRYHEHIIPSSAKWFNLILCFLFFSFLTFSLTTLRNIHIEFF